SFMLLDEPFTGIDPLAISDISDLVRYLKQRGLGVLITDHQVRETLQIVDRAYVMYDGEVLFNGSPESVLQNEDVRRVYLGEQFAA
ncbi:MAG: LPS export ABC transporter ATP-binding protein, partial [Hyphomonas sp.]|nr:LPS export ABC transporter ATP-binding protein [Hyphomonas sp.]